LPKPIKFSEQEWLAHADGAAQAEAKRPLSVPQHLTPLEQIAFREGYKYQKEEARTRPAAHEIYEMLGGKSLTKVLRRLVQ
jgi:hypothetical protein